MNTKVTTEQVVIKSIMFQNPPVILFGSSFTTLKIIPELYLHQSNVY